MGNLWVTRVCLSRNHTRKIRRSVPLILIIGLLWIFFGCLGLYALVQRRGGFDKLRIEPFLDNGSVLSDTVNKIANLAKSSNEEPVQEL